MIVPERVLLTGQRLAHVPLQLASLLDQFELSHCPISSDLSRPIHALVPDRLHHPLVRGIVFPPDRAVPKGASIPSCMPLNSICGLK